MGAVVSGPRAELLAIAVGDGARGKGVGRGLLGACVGEFGRLGVSEFCVVTHGVDARSNGFYVGCGFRLVRGFTNHGKPMNEYVVLTDGHYLNVSADFAD